MTLGGSRTFCDEQMPNPFYWGAGLRGDQPLYEPDAVALRAEPSVSGVHRRHQQEPEQHQQADLRLSTVRGEQAHREGRHHECELHLGATVDRGGRTMWMRCRGS